MTSEPLAADKARLRRLVMARRNAADTFHGVRAGEALMAHGLSLLERASEGPVSAFWPTRNEIDVRPLMQALADRGRTLALPVMAGPADPLTFRAWAPGDALVTGPFRIEEPAATKTVVVPSVVLVPLVAFDAEGYRVGYGGGYYDRTLAVLNAGPRSVIAVGVAFDEQEIVRVPRAPHDARLDWLLTPSGAKHTRA